jgi:hypothetical protein
MTSLSKSLIDGLKSRDIRSEIWWFCASMTLDCERQYDGFIPHYLLNENFDIGWHCGSMILEREICYMIVCASMTLECEIWYWVDITINSINWLNNIVLCWPLDDTRFEKFDWWSNIFETLYAIYEDFVYRWPLNAKYDIWWFCARWALNVKYDIWW